MISGIIGREAESFAQLSFGDSKGFDNRMGGVEIRGIEEEETGAGDNNSEGARVGIGIEEMDGLVCEPISEVNGSGI